MNKNNKKTKKHPAIKRNVYTIDQRERARKYYLMGLKLTEVSKLLDNIPVRTLEKWQINEKWTELKETEPLKERVLNLKRAGHSYNEISNLLNINRTTVWRWLKQAKKSEQSE